MERFVLLFAILVSVVTGCSRDDTPTTQTTNPPDRWDGPLPWADLDIPEPYEPGESPKPILTLAEAIEANEIEEVRRIIAQKSPPNQQFLNKMSASLFDTLPRHERTAVYKLPPKTPLSEMRSEILVMLLQAGADPTAANRRGTPLLHRVASGSNLPLAGTLLYYGADPNARDDKGRTTLHCCANQVAMTRYLLRHGAEPNPVDKEGMTPLFSARSPDAVCLQVELGADVNAKSHTGDTALHHATRYHDNMTTVEALLDADADVNAANAKGDTPLHCAFERRKAPNIIKALLEAGADVQALNDNAETPLHLAARLGTSDKVQLLLDAVVKTDAETVEDAQLAEVIHSAIPDAAPEEPRMLREAGAENNVTLESTLPLRHRFDETPLPHHAARSGFPESLQSLLDSGAKVDAENPEDGKTALYYAARAGHAETVRFLLDAGAGVDAGDTEHPREPAIRRAHAHGPIPREGGRGEKPLQAAACHGHTEVVRLLLKAGADVDLQDDMGETALFAAAKEGHRDAVTALLDAGADTAIADTDGVSALHVAAGRGSAEIVQALIRAGADIEAIDNSKATPLCAAASYGKAECVRLLLEADANTETNACTPLHRAATQGHAEVCRLLLAHGAEVKKGKSGAGTHDHHCIVDAANHGMELMQVFLDHGVQLGEKTRNACACNLLSHAAETGSAEQCQAVIDQFAKDCPPPVFSEAVYHAANSRVLAVLIEAGADINYSLIHNSYKRPTALHDSLTGEYVMHDDCGDLAYKRLHMVDPLVQAGADVNVKDFTGDTPLHQTLKINTSKINGGTERLKSIIHILADAGADMNALNKDGETPLSVTVLDDRLDIAQCLLDAGADINAKNSSGETLLHGAASGQDFDLMRLLLESGADVNAVNAEGYTPLHATADQNDYYVARYLLQKGADANLLDNEGDTPLDCVDKNGITPKTAFQKLLQAYGGKRSRDLKREPHQ